MKRKVLAAVFAVSVTCIGVSPAFAAEHHPPKFGPHDKQCLSDPNQPNCPGSH
jgi:hypothetical protein